MRLVDNIGVESRQRIRVTHADLTLDVDLTLTFLGVTQIWFANVAYGADRISGVKLSLGTLHFVSKNWPFDLVVRDTSELGVDPFQINDFATGRCELYLVEPSEMETVRGAPVEI